MDLHLRALGGAVFAAGMGLAMAATIATAQNAAPQQAPAQKAPKVAKSTSSYFDNWALTCVDYDDPKQKRTCSARSQILQKDTTNPLFVWEMGFNQENKLTAVLQIPTGVMIAPGIELNVGKAAPRKIAFESCEPSRCVATFPVDEKIVKEIAASPKVDIVVKSSTGSTVTFQMDAAGIDKASLGLLNR